MRQSYRAKTERDLAELVLAARRGAPGAWRGLVERFAPVVLSIPREMGLSREDCEEVFQDTWTALYSGLGGLRSPRAAGAWIVTTARRLAWERKRGGDRAGVGEDHALDVPDPTEGPLEVLVAAEQRAHVERAMEALSPRCREILWRSYLDPREEGYTRIADAMAMPPGSLGPTRLRCLAKLLRELERGNPTYDAIERMKHGSGST